MANFEQNAREREYGNSIYYTCLLLYNILLILQLYTRFQNVILKCFSKNISDLIQTIFEIIGPLTNSIINTQEYFLESILLLLGLAISTTSPGISKLKQSKKSANLLLLFAFFLIYLPPIIILKNNGLSALYFLFSQLIALVCLIRAGAFINSSIILPKTDIFNDSQEQFPQNELRLENENSVIFKTKYQFENKWQTGYLPVLSPQRGVMVIGGQGTGKTASILVPALWQSIAKGYSAIVYDFKYPEFTIEAYNATINALHKNKDIFGKNVVPKFGNINFDCPQESLRFNPIAPKYMASIDEAFNISNTFLDNLNKSWIKKEGEFFPESAKNILTMAMWYLRLIDAKYDGQGYFGPLCTLPHAIELLTRDMAEILKYIQKYEELNALSAIFVTALNMQAMDQLGGQIGSVQTAMATLATPTLYWILTGENEIDINNFEQPTIICLGNNAPNSKFYSPVLAILLLSFMRKCYERNKITDKSKIRNLGLFIDEFPSLYINNFDHFINTVRSYNVSTWIGMQDFEQLKRDYSKENADVITNTMGSIFAGKVNFDSAKKLSEMFGETNQKSVSNTLNQEKISFSISEKLQKKIPASKISQLATGEFVGTLADTFHQKLHFKQFRGHIYLPDEYKHSSGILPKYHDLNDEKMKEVMSKNKRNIQYEIDRLLELEGEFWG